MALVAGAGFALVAVGLLRLQVVEHEDWKRLSEENRVRLEVLRAPRGAIFDRHGVLLADNRPSFNIVFRPSPAESLQRVRATVGSDWVRRVGGLVGLDTTQVRALVLQANRTGQTALLRHGAPFEVLAAVEETRADLPGLEVQIEPMRSYPHGTLAAHLLGYAGQINEVELDSLSDSGYQLGDLIGRAGVERSYEEVLRGRDGAEFVVVNAMGKRVSTLGSTPPRAPEAGHDVTLTIDLRVQQAMELAMAKVDRGAAVAIDPRDGGILGMVSRPVFDPNEFSQGITYARWREMSEGDAFPLLNRAIQGAYPPGSTFKVVTMLAGLEAGVVRADTHMAPCTGGYFFGGRVFNCWNKNGHGSLDLISALEFSCDVYFYQLGPRVGLPHLEAAARALGFGGRTGIDLPQERSGLVPSVAFYEKRFGKGHNRPGQMLNLAIGQGELLVTPLQLALMAAQVSMNGRPLRPHVVSSIGGVGPERPGHAPQTGFVTSAANWETVHRAMQLVVDGGTGTASRVPGVPVAGKTGTAQNPHGRDHAVYLCYAPADDPRIAMAFVIENSGHGGSVAAPMAGAILRTLFAPDTTHTLILMHEISPADTASATHGD
ncbi:MAG: penicillin-binding protein 2 [Candidatus Eisenbacteria bacterium]